MATPSPHLAALRRQPSRYRRDQRIARVGTALSLTVLALICAWTYHRSPDPADSPDDVATAPATSAPQVSDAAWLTESQSSIDELVTARNHISAAAARHDLAGTGAACGDATSAVARLHRQMPSPEPAVTHSLQEAISNYYVGLPYCVSASKAQDGPGMQHAATYISQGDAAMRVALDLLGNVGGTDPRDLPVLIV